MSTQLQIVDGTQESDWLNSTEAARYLRLLSRNGQPCLNMLRNLVHQGRIPFYKPFGRLIFKRTELEKFIVTSRQGNQSGNFKVFRPKR